MLTTAKIKNDEKSVNENERVHIQYERLNHFGGLQLLIAAVYRELILTAQKINEISVVNSEISTTVNVKTGSRTKSSDGMRVTSKNVKTAILNVLQSSRDGSRGCIHELYEGQQETTEKREGQLGDCKQAELLNIADIADLYGRFSVVC